MAAKLHNVNWKRVPERGTPGDLYYASGDKAPELFLCARNGVLCPVSEFFTVKVEGQGPEGKRGRDGRDGVNGKDGVSIQGPKGEQGDLLYVGPAEIEAAAKQLREQRGWMLAKIQQAVADANKLKAHPTRTTLIKHLEALRNGL